MANDAQSTGAGSPPLVLTGGPDVIEVVRAAQANDLLAAVTLAAAPEVRALLVALAAGILPRSPLPPALLRDLGEALADMGVVTLGRWRLNLFRPPPAPAALAEAGHLTADEAACVAVLLRWPLGVLPADLAGWAGLPEPRAQTLWQALIETGTLTRVNSALS